MKKVLKRFYRFFFPKKVKESISIYTKDVFVNKPYVIGEYTYGKPLVLFDDQNTNLIVGKFCSIAANVTIFLGGNHRTDWISTYPFNVLNEDFPEANQIFGHPATKGDVIIGNDVWIGRGAVIMSGITISDGAVIGANSVVTKDIGAYEIWAGNPAVLIKKRFSEEDILFLKELKWWEKDLDYISKNIRVLCSENINLLRREL